MSSEFAGARLSHDLEQALRSRMTARVCPKGSTLYQQGTAAVGIYLVETGSVRMLLRAGEDQNQLLETAGAGAILGLSESMSGDHYRVTAEAEETTTVAFIERKNFLKFLDDHPDYCMQVVQLLSENLHSLYHKFRSVSAHPGRPRRRTPDEQLN